MNPKQKALIWASKSFKGVVELCKYVLSKYGRRSLLKALLNYVNMYYLNIISMFNLLSIYYLFCLFSTFMTCSRKIHQNRSKTAS